MKNSVLIILCALCLTACGNKSTNTQTPEVEETTKFSVELPKYKMEELLAVAEQQVGNEVIVIGHVTHTCVHAGKRCFITGEDGETSMRIEAGGEIGGFNRELVGSELAIKGIVRENKLTKEYLDQTEKELKEGALEEDGSAETCAAELNNISSMREWMKANNKDYYSIYYVDGLDYEVISK